VSALSVLRAICVADKSLSEQLVQLDGMESIMQCISSLCPSATTNLAWQLLYIQLDYGNASFILNEYRPLFYSKFQSLIAFTSDIPSLKDRIGLLKSLGRLIELNPESIEMGSGLDEMKPFVDMILSGFTWKVDLAGLKGMSS
jgi:hypothetical protein